MGLSLYLDLQKEIIEFSRIKDDNDGRCFYPCLKVVRINNCLIDRKFNMCEFTLSLANIYLQAIATEVYTIEENQIA